MTIPYFALWATHDLSFKDFKKNHEIGHSIQSCLIELCQVLSTELEILERGLRKKTFLIPHRQTRQSIHWTGKATDLVELLYALDTCDCINNGKIGVEELADALSNIFGVEIKNCYNVYMNMKRRKDDSRTYFLDGKATLIWPTLSKYFRPSKTIYYWPTKCPGRVGHFISLLLGNILCFYLSKTLSS